MSFDVGYEANSTPGFPELLTRRRGVVCKGEGFREHLPGMGHGKNKVKATNSCIAPQRPVFDAGRARAGRPQTPPHPAMKVFLESLETL